MDDPLLSVALLQTFGSPLDLLVGLVPKYPILEIPAPLGYRHKGDPHHRRG